MKTDVRSDTLIGPAQCEGVSLYVAWVSDIAATADSPSQYVENLRNYVLDLAAWCDRVRAVCDSRLTAAKQ
jgi:hypothetical protein